MNWTAYAVAVVAQLIIGYIWFHPSVMGKMWAKANNSDYETMKPDKPGMMYGLNLVFTLLFTVFLMINVTGPGQDTAPDGHSFHTFQHGFAHAVILTIMIIIPIFGTPAVFEKRGMNWVIVHVGYWFLRLAVAGGILSMWR